jgi:hypothetical protein
MSDPHSLIASVPVAGCVFANPNSFIKQTAANRNKMMHKMGISAMKRNWGWVAGRWTPIPIKKGEEDNG